MRKLGDLFHFINGRGFKKTEWKDSGLPIIRIQNLNNSNAEFNYYKGAYDEKIEINNGDLLFSWSGTIGTSFGPHIWNRETGLLNQHIFKLEFKDKIERDYAYYALKFITEEIEKQVNGAVGLVHITKEKLNQFKIPLPPLSEQRRIIAILDETFAAIAKAKDNAEQNLKSAKELFESYLQGVFENKREGWEEKTVQKFVEEGIIYKPLDGNHGEIHPLKNDYVDIGIPFIMSRDMKNGSIDEENCKFISEKQARNLRTGFAINGDVLLSHKGTIGSVAILQTKNDFVVLTPQITYYRIKDHSKFCNRFIYYQFLSPGFQKAIYGIAEGGSTRAYIGITKQLSLKLVIAPLKAQKAIIQKLDALSTKTKNLEAIYQTKIKNLEELKKSILQKAFNGELAQAEVVL